MSKVIMLNGTNKKLLHQCANYTVRANRADDNGFTRTFSVLTNLARHKLNLVCSNLNIDKNKYTVAPCCGWNGIVLIE